MVPRIRTPHGIAPPATAIATRLRRHRGDTGRRLPSPPPTDEEPVGVGAVAVEEDDVPGVEALVLDEAAPALGEDIALAAAPVGVAEPPPLPGLVLEAQQLRRLADQREVLLRVLLGYHQPVQLPHVARRQRLLEHRLPLRGRRRRQLRGRRRAFVLWFVVGGVEVEEVVLVEHGGVGSSPEGVRGAVWSRETVVK